MIRILIASFFALSLPLFAISILPVQANAGNADSPTFLLPVNDGYGVADCLTQGGECAVQVANAWCVAQGYHHASDMRPANEGASAGRIAITCDR